MKKTTAFLAIFVLAAVAVLAQNTSLYVGRASNQAQYIGLTLHSEIWDFLFFQFDAWKYLNNDPALATTEVLTNRGDFLGISGNIALKFPLHLIPSFERLAFLQPYMLAGFGLAVESLNFDFLSTPNLEGGTSFFDKIRRYKSFGFGFIIMITSNFGFQADWRTVGVPVQTKMGWPSRKFNRVSIGICFGAYQREKKDSKS